MPYMTCKAKHRNMGVCSGVAKEGNFTEIFLYISVKLYIVKHINRTYINIDLYFEKKLSFVKKKKTQKRN